MAYTLYTQAGYISDDEIIAKLSPTEPLHIAHAQAIRNLKRDMCRYSNQDCDVLGAAHNIAVTGRTEVAAHEARWVEVMNKQAGAL